MTTLGEIERAVESLSREDREELFRFLARGLRAEQGLPQGATVVRERGDVLLTAAPGSPPMTPEYVRMRFLSSWPGSNELMSDA